MNYRAEVDALRAIAIIPVVLFHAGFTLFSGGYVGVDIFFVISGYLITRILLIDLQKKSFSFAKFYERRARRIFPALFFVMASITPFAWAWLLPEDLKSFAKSLYFVSTFCSNILFWRTSGYFDGDAELKPLLHTWSLGVEEQFYLLFPIFMLLTWRFKRALLGWLIVFLMLLSLCLADMKAAISPMNAFYFLPYRAWELLVGAIIANYENSSEKIEFGTVINNLLSILGASFVVFSILFLNKNTPYPSYWTLLPVGGSALIIFFTKPDTLVYKLIVNKILVGIGLISYSAYLWHQPIFALAKHKMGNELSGLVLGGLVSIVFGLAYLSWKYVERPFRSVYFIARRKFIIISTVGLLLFIVLGALGDVMDGFPRRFNYEERYVGDVGQEAYYRYAKEKFLPCMPDTVREHSLKWNNTYRCMQSKSNVPVDVVLLGDSHAEHLFIGLAEALTKRNIAYYIRATPSLLKNSEFEWVFKEIKNNQAIHTVLISMYWVGQFNTLPNDRSFEKELAETVMFLSKSGKRVVIFNDVPRFPFTAERCKYFADGVGRSTCEISRWSTLRYELNYTTMLEKLAEKIPNVSYVQLGDLFCNAESCSMAQGERVMYRDRHHLNILGSQYVGQKISQQLPELNQ